MCEELAPNVPFGRKTAHSEVPLKYPGVQRTCERRLSIFPPSQPGGAAAGSQLPKVPSKT
jgi:hypothetical protein